MARPLVATEGFSIDFVGAENTQLQPLTAAEAFFLDCVGAASTQLQPLQQQQKPLAQEALAIHFTTIIAAQVSVTRLAGPL